MNQRQESAISLMREILRDGYQALQVIQQEFHEDIIEHQCRIVAVVAPKTVDEGELTRRTVEGEGVGLVDAFFHGLIDQFSPEYPSLSTLRFVGFSVTGMLDKDRPISAAGSDALSEARLQVENSDGHQFEFMSSSRSITAATLQATLDAVEYFVNSEMAFMATRRALDDAQTRARPDLVQTFAARLAVLVRNTSYSEALAEKHK